MNDSLFLSRTCIYVFVCVVLRKTEVERSKRQLDEKLKREKQNVRLAGAVMRGAGLRVVHTFAHSELLCWLEQCCRLRRWKIAKARHFPKSAN